MSSLTRRCTNSAQSFCALATLSSSLPLMSVRTANSGVVNIGCSDQLKEFAPVPNASLVSAIASLQGVKAYLHRQRAACSAHASAHGCVSPLSSVSSWGRTCAHASAVLVGAPRLANARQAPGFQFVQKDFGERAKLELSSGQAASAPKFSAQTPPALSLVVISAGRDGTALPRA